MSQGRGQDIRTIPFGNLLGKIQDGLGVNGKYLLTDLPNSGTDPLTVEVVNPYSVSPEASIVRSRGAKGWITIARNDLIYPYPGQFRLLSNGVDPITDIVGFGGSALGSQIINFASADTIGTGWAFGAGSYTHTPGDTDPVIWNSAYTKTNQGNYYLTVNINTETIGTVQVQIVGSDNNYTSIPLAVGTYNFNCASLGDIVSVSLIPTIDSDAVVNGLALYEIVVADGQNDIAGYIVAAVLSPFQTAATNITFATGDTAFISGPDADISYNGKTISVQKVITINISSASGTFNVGDTITGTDTSATGIVITTDGSTIMQVGMLSGDFTGETAISNQLAVTADVDSMEIGNDLNISGTTNFKAGGKFTHKIVYVFSNGTFGNDYILYEIDSIGNTFNPASADVNGFPYDDERFSDTNDLQSFFANNFTNFGGSIYGCFSRNYSGINANSSNAGMYNVGLLNGITLNVTALQNKEFVFNCRFYGNDPNGGNIEIFLNESATGIVIDLANGISNLPKTFTVTTNAINFNEDNFHHWAGDVIVDLDSDELKTINNLSSSVKYFRIMAPAGKSFTIVPGNTTNIYLAAGSGTITINGNSGPDSDALYVEVMYDTNGTPLGVRQLNFVQTIPL